MESTLISQLANDIVSLANDNTDDTRFIVGIVGPPASGKSFLAEELAIRVNASIRKSLATPLSMDGYHYHNDILHDKGIYPHKGCHFTFDCEAFIAKLIEVKENPDLIRCPIYDRSLHNATPDAHMIEPDHRIVFVEGNYLLIHLHPWEEIRNLLNYSIYLEVDPVIQYNRLLERHLTSGKSREEAAAKVHHTDLPNSELIAKSKTNADIIVRLPANFPDQQSTP